MQKVRMRGIQIQGKRVSGAEVFIKECEQDEETGTGAKKVVGSKQPTPRDPCPAWVIPDTFSPPWPLNFSIAQVRKWWRLGIISEELHLLQCTSCPKSFIIMRRYDANIIYCPYCRGVARPIVDQEAYLTAMCKYVLNRDGRKYTKEKQ